MKYSIRTEADLNFEDTVEKVKEELQKGGSKVKKAFIDINGMDCASDAVNIERSLMKLKGVKSASVNYLIHEGFVNVSNNVTKKVLTTTIKRAGYKVRNIRFEEENEKS